MRTFIRFLRTNRYMLAVATLIGVLALLPGAKPAVAGPTWCCSQHGQTCDTDCNGNEGDQCHEYEMTNCDPPVPEG